jgi:hypothetical protein
MVFIWAIVPESRRTAEFSKLFPKTLAEPTNQLVEYGLVQRLSQ